MLDRPFCWESAGVRRKKGPGLRGELGARGGILDPSTKRLLVEGAEKAVRNKLTKSVGGGGRNCPLIEVGRSKLKRILSSKGEGKSLSREKKKEGGASKGGTWFQPHGGGKGFFSLWGRKELLCIRKGSPKVGTTGVPGKTTSTPQGIYIKKKEILLHLGGKKGKNRHKGAKIQGERN